MSAVVRTGVGSAGRAVERTVEKGVLRAGLGHRLANPTIAALFLAGGYAATAIGWLLVSGALLWSEIVRSREATIIVVTNGTLFVVFTTAVLFFVIYRFLKRLQDSEARFLAAQDELRQKDLAVRQGYVDVLDAVTGGKLVLITEDELDSAVGEVMMRPHALTDAHALSDARRTIFDCLVGIPLDDRDAVMLAVSEALTNAIKHGRRGEYAIHRSGNCLQFVVRDFGPGIDFRQLPKATLVQGFSTTSTMGMGFTIMLEVADRVLLTTDAHGTVVVLEVEIPQTAEPITDRSLAAILHAC